MSRDIGPGQVYGRLTVQHLDPDRRRGPDRHLRWVCLCVCGRTAVVTGKQLRSGKTRSCGCLARETARRTATKHGGSASREYLIWKGMKTRCSNPKADSFPRYGGRGITVCERWSRSFADFLVDMGPAPPGMTIERVDNSLGYGPGNCRWATGAEQQSNRRNNVLITLDGETRTLAEWCRIKGVNYFTARTRIISGVAPARALDPERMKKANCGSAEGCG
jgi:hypothetical protein